MTDVRLLSDKPSDEDKFGSHSRIASGLCEILQNQKEMRVIGLLGPWGSGKSSVIRQAFAQMRAATNSDSTLFFEYDAWLHQSDNPRRSFLERLTDFLLSDARDIIEQEDWNDDLESLAGRQEDTETETTSSLSTSGKVAAITAVGIPIGLALVDFQTIKEAFGPATDQTDPHTAFWVLLAGILCLLAPLIGLLALWFVWRPWKRSWKEHGLKLFFKAQHWKNRAKRFENESLISFVTQTHTENVKQKVRISPRPTSIEFQKMLRKLMKAIAEKELELVCVIDNLDRLEADDAIQLWSTMRILFLADGEETDESLSPRVIVPLDDDALKALFEQGGNEGSRRAESFTDKTFDTTLSVGLPITSGWRDYLEAQLRSSFGNLITVDDIYWITKLIEQRSDQGDFSVTPRRINKHINAIATLWLQRPKQALPITSLSFYSMFKEQIDDQGILAFISSDAEWLGPDNANWRGDLAAIHHSVPLEVAFQVVMEEPLRAAIRTDDFEEFKRCATTPGAWAIIEKVSENPPEAADEGYDPEFIRSAMTLITKLETEAGVERDLCLQMLSSNYAKSADLKVYPDEVSTFARTAVQHGGADKQAILERIAAHTMDTFCAGDFSDKNVDQFSTDGLALNGIAKEHDLAELKFSISADEPRIFLILSEIANAQILQLVDVRKKQSEIVPALVELFKEGKRTDEVAGAVKALSRPSGPFIQGQKRALSWQSLLDEAAPVIQNNATSHDAFQAAVDIFGLLHQGHKPTRDKFEQIVNSGQIQNRLNEADNEKSVQLLADLATVLLFQGKDFAGPNGQTWDDVAKKHSDFVEKVENAIIWYQRSVGLALLNSSISKSPSFSGIAHQLFHRVSKGNRLRVSTEYLFQNYDALSDEFGTEELKELLSKLRTRRNFWEEFGKLELSEGNERLSFDLASCGDEETQKIKEQFEAQIRDLNKDTWSDLLENGGYQLGVANEFKARFGKSLTLTGALPDALELYVSDVYSTDNDKLRHNWFAACSLISAATRSTKFKKVRDKIVNGSTIGNLFSLMSIGGDAFLQEGQFASKGDGTTIYLIDPFIKSDDGRGWLLEHKDSIASILAGSSANSKATVQETLVATHREAPDEHKGEISNLADALNAPIPNASEGEEGGNPPSEKGD